MSIERHARGVVVLCAGVVGQVDAGRVVGEHDESRAVDTGTTRAAPDVGHAEVALRGADRDVGPRVRRRGGEVRVGLGVREVSRRRRVRRRLGLVDEGRDLSLHLGERVLERRLEDLPLWKDFAASAPRRARDGLRPLRRLRSSVNLIRSVFRLAMVALMLPSASWE